MGESEIDLGGLWLGDVDFELGAGEHFIEFGEPLPFPMAHAPTLAVRMTGRIGAVNIEY